MEFSIKSLGIMEKLPRKISIILFSLKVEKAYLFQLWN